MYTIQSEVAIILILGVVALVLFNREMKALREDVMNNNGQISPERMKKINKLITLDEFESKLAG